MGLSALEFPKAMPSLWTLGTLQRITLRLEDGGQDVVFQPNERRRGSGAVRPSASRGSGFPTGFCSPLYVLCQGTWNHLFCHPQADLFHNHFPKFYFVNKVISPLLPYVCFPPGARGLLVREHLSFRLRGPVLWRRPSLSFERRSGASSSLVFGTTLTLSTFSTVPATRSDFLQVDMVDRAVSHSLGFP